MADLDIRIIPGRSGDIYSDIFLKPRERSGFVQEEGRLEVPVYLVRMIGVDDEADYINRVFDLDEKLKREKNRFLRLEGGLARAIDPKWMEAFNEIWKLVAPMRQPRASDIAEIYLRSGLLGNLEGQCRQLLKSALSLVLGLFISRVENKDITKNFLVKQLYWLQLYFFKELDFCRPGEDNSVLLYWGASSRDEAYFLLLLAALGCDVLVFEPGGGGKWQQIPHIEDYVQVFQLPRQASLAEFPRTPRGRSEETVAYRAEQEIHQMLHNPDTGAFVPWQLEALYPAPFTLTTTFDEMLLLWSQEARFRPGFEVRERLVMIPSIFAKVAGVAADMDFYLEKIQALKKENLLIQEIKSLPVARAPQGGIDQGLLDERGLFSLEKVAARYRQAPFARLRPAMQKLLVGKINELSSLADYLLAETNPAMKFRMFRLILGLDSQFFHMMQQFDYPFQVPKLLVFDNGEPGLNEDDAIILAFFHLVGFDVAIICPGGYASVERYIAEGYYQIHRLEQFRFDLQSDILDKKTRKGFLDWLRG